MAEDGGTPRLHVVEVGVAVRVRDERSLGRSTKYGVPPTDPNARTGEFDAAGDHQVGPANSSSALGTRSLAATSGTQHLGYLAGEVGEHE